MKNGKFRRLIGKTLDISASTTQVVATTTAVTGSIVGGIVSAVGIGTIFAAGHAAGLIATAGEKIKEKANSWGSDVEARDEDGKLLPCKSKWGKSPP